MHLITYKIKYSAALRSLAFALLGVLLGGVAFSGQWQLLAFAGLLTIFVQMADSRVEAFVLCFGYYLAASRGLPLGISNYMGDGPIPAILLWLAANAISASVHAVLWAQDRSRRAWLQVASLLLLALPPFGISGWANPLVSAGVLFPALGFGGIAQLLVLLLLLKFRFFTASIVIGMLAIGANRGVIGNPKNSWSSYSTASGQAATLSDTEKFREYVKLANKINDEQPRFVLLPESTVPSWNGIVQNLWLQTLSDRKTVGIGTMLTPPDEKHRQAVVFLSAGEVAVYRQRQPVPVTMWMPWSDDGYAAGWFDNPLTTIQGQRLGVLICYESFLVWPILHTATQHPQRFLIVSNLWWAKGTSIAKIQDAIAHSWSRLFHIPYTIAVNT